MGSAYARALATVAGLIDLVCSQTQVRLGTIDMSRRLELRQRAGTDVWSTR